MGKIDTEKTEPTTAMLLLSGLGGVNRTGKLEEGGAELHTLAFNTAITREREELNVSRKSSSTAAHTVATPQGIK